MKGTVTAGVLESRLMTRAMTVLRRHFRGRGGGQWPSDEEVLAWASTLPEREILHMRNVGKKSIEVLMRRLGNGSPNLAIALGRGSLPWSDT